MNSKDRGHGAETGEMPVLRRKPDRRGISGREALLRRVRCEFQETWGLCVTLPQAARLFGLPQDMCLRVLNELVAEGAIHASGSYFGALRQHFVGTLFLSHRAANASPRRGAAAPKDQRKQDSP